MTNREKITELIETNFPYILVQWEQIGDKVKKNKNGVEIERHSAFGNCLRVFCPNSSLMGSVKWLDDEYKGRKTLREIVKEREPEKINCIWDGGTYGCPSEYGNTFNGRIK